MDECPINLNPKQNYTWNQRGEKRVKIINGGQGKLRTTVCMTVCKNGRKLAPFIIFKANPGKSLNKKLLKLQVVREKKVHVACQKKAWSNVSTIKLYIKSDIAPYLGKNTRSILILDSATPHVSKEVKDVLKGLNTEKLIIPEGCTTVLQPVDLGINSLLKREICYLYNQRLIQSNGNAAKIDREDFLKDLSKAWENVSPDSIRKCWVKAGIV